MLAEMTADCIMIIWLVEITAEMTARCIYVSLHTIVQKAGLR